MADNSTIEWTDATWNIVTGCEVVSPGCTNCYAMRLAGTRLARHPSRAGLTKPSRSGPVWTGEVRFNAQWLDQPLRWRKPRRIFVAAHGDLFHEAVPDEVLDQVFAVMALSPQHTFQVLTKRPERMREYFSWRATNLSCGNLVADAAVEMDLERFNRHGGMLPAWPFPNVWLGVSVEDQHRADERIPHLLATPAAVRFVSAEPLLGPVDLTEIAQHRSDLRASVVFNSLRGTGGYAAPVAKLDWVIVGGESQAGARPMHPDWARSLRDQCAGAGVAFHFKQWGEWGPDTGPSADGRDSVMDGTVPVAWYDGASWHIAGSGYDVPLAESAGRRGEWVYRLGKRATGRLLDGRTHDEVPQ